MFLACSRFIFFLAFMIGAFVMGASLYLEYGLGLEPCWLCIVQRAFLLGGCVVNLAAYLHVPGRVGMCCYSVAATVLALGGATSALRQVLMQRLPPEQLMFCQPNLSCMWRNLSPSEIFSVIYRGNEACAHIRWTLFDLSIPELSLLAFIGLLVLSSYQIFRSISYRHLPCPGDAR
ncbi:MAG: disulfide bond formation protein B [Pseudomonadota bacterium]